MNKYIWLWLIVILGSAIIIWNNSDTVRCLWFAYDLGLHSYSTCWVK